MFQEEIMFFYPVYTSILDDIDNDKIEKEVLEKRKTDSGVSYSNVGGWHSNNIDLKDEFFSNSETKKLVDAVENGADHLYYLWQIKKDPELQNFWFNVNEKRDINESHSHPGSYFSFCYYVKTNKDSGPIEFLRDDASAHYEMQAITNRYTFTTYTINPTPGLLVAFPSYIRHRVLPNMSEEVRISIAFNFK